MNTENDRPEVPLVEGEIEDGGVKPGPDKPSEIPAKTKGGGKLDPRSVPGDDSEEDENNKGGGKPDPDPAP